MPWPVSSALRLSVQRCLKVASVSWAMAEVSFARPDFLEDVHPVKSVSVRAATVKRADLVMRSEKATWGGRGGSARESSSSFFISDGRHLFYPANLIQFVFVNE